MSQSFPPTHKCYILSGQICTTTHQQLNGPKYSRTMEKGKRYTKAIQTHLITMTQQCYFEKINLFLRHVERV